MLFFFFRQFVLTNYKLLSLDLLRELQINDRQEIIRKWKKFFISSKPNALTIYFNISLTILDAQIGWDDLGAFGAALPLPFLLLELIRWLMLLLLTIFFGWGTKLTLRQITLRQITFLGLYKEVCLSCIHKSLINKLWILPQSCSIRDQLALEELSIYTSIT